MPSSEIKEYSEVSPFGYIKDGKVYLKGYLEFKDREIGVVREDEKESLQYFVNRFEMARKKVEEVEEAVETAENKGSYLMKLIHMRTYLAQYNGLGDFIVLFNQLNDLEDQIREYVEKNRDKNTQIKKALLTEAESLKGSTDWKHASEKFKELKMNWIKTGSAYKEVEEQYTRDFNQCLEYFFARRKNFFDEQAKIARERMRRYSYLLDQVRRINRSGGGQEYAQKVKDIQQEWKNVGKLPPQKFRKIFNDFKRETGKFFNDLKGIAPPVRKTPIEMKKDHLAEAEKMLKNGAPFNISDIKKLQGFWKKLGKLPQPEDRDLNLKFRIVCNEIFESHFLEKTARSLHADFYQMSTGQQLRIKIDMLKDSILQDEQELDAFNDRYGDALNADQADFSLIQERNNFINKLKTKHRILKKLQEDLN